MLRCFHSNKEIQNLALEGIKYYRNFRKIVGVEVYLYKTGYLFLAQNDYRSEVDNLSKDINIKTLKANYASTKFKAINFQDINQILFEQDAGWINPMQACHAWVQAGVKNNGLLLENCLVSDIIQKNNKAVEVQTSFGKLGTDKVIFCNGVWSDILNKGYYKNSKPRHIQINLYKIRDTFESYPCYLDEENDWYGKFEQRNYMWLGQPYPNRTVDISKNAVPDIDSAKELITKAQSRFHWLRNAELITSKAKLDFYSTDGLPIIRKDEFLDDVYRVVGLSGNGIKLAPSVALKVSSIMEAL
jgi:glycine/D-amino acid oxidase-like deaminating enzyme